MPDNERCEVMLYTVNKPCEELRFLGGEMKKTINYYTVHGASSFLVRFIWKRWLYNSLPISSNLRLQSYEFLTSALNYLCPVCPAESAVRSVEDAPVKGQVLHITPIWLLNRGKINLRGSYYGCEEDFGCGH